MILRVKARLDAKDDTVEDCLAKTLLLEQEKGELDWEDVCMLAAVFTLGGVHSVSSRRGSDNYKTDKHTHSPLS